MPGSSDSSGSCAEGVSVPSVLSLPPLSLYVHFPWCVRKCPYCDFNSYTLSGELAEGAYLRRLERDLEAQSAEVAGRTVHSVFFGGGTPSLFSPQAMGHVLEFARRHLALRGDAEITLEANPGTIERGAFREYRAAGITRVSLGAQSFDARALAALGRIHSPAETHRAAEELHAAGLGNFNLDLMYALPGQDTDGALRDVRAALSLAPAHLSHYQLTLEPGTVFAAQPPPLPDEDSAADMLGACAEELARAGYVQYEVSAYARAGMQCRHNLNYWSFGDYLGVGAGAHGKLTDPARAQIIRTRQLRDPRRYQAAADAALARRAITPPELPFEFMLNALRLCEGFAAPMFTARTGLELQVIAAPLATAVQRGLMLSTTTGYRPSTLGLRFLNDTLLLFMAQTAKMSGNSGLSIAGHEVTSGIPGALFTGSGRSVAE
jgi:putative oxygen-independent coproporphyrinogen III oxidase